MVSGLKKKDKTKENKKKMVSVTNGIRGIRASPLPVLLEADRMHHRWLHSVNRLPRIIPQTLEREFLANPRSLKEKFLGTSVICIFIECHLSSQLGQNMLALTALSFKFISQVYLHFTKGSAPLAQVLFLLDSFLVFKKKSRERK